MASFKLACPDQALALPVGPLGVLFGHRRHARHAATPEPAWTGNRQSEWDKVLVLKMTGQGAGRSCCKRRCLVDHGIEAAPVMARASANIFTASEQCLTMKVVSGCDIGLTRSYFGGPRPTKNG